MKGNCGDCWYRVQVASGGSYTSFPDDRCWHWENLGQRLKAAGECDLWRPMTTEEATRRTAYFNQSFQEWLAQQRAALEVLR